MSSRELALDLELFINSGLKEGWRGWPTKRNGYSALHLDTVRVSNWVSVEMLRGLQQGHIHNLESSPIGGS